MTPALARKRRLTQAILWAERLAPPIAPIAAAAALFACLAVSGAAAHLPAALDLALIAALAIASLAVAIPRLRRLRAPTQPEIDRRLEQRAPHRPLTALADTPAIAGAPGLWQAHRDRALSDIARLRPTPPRLARLDAATLAAAASLALLAIVLAGPDAGPRLWDALTPRLSSPAPPAKLQAWITPPATIAMPPIFLRAGDPTPIAAPAGAKLTVSVTGGARRPRLVLGDARETFRRLDAGRFQAELTLTDGGELTITRGGDRLARWTLDIAPAAPPSIRATGPATIAANALRLPWEAADQYGLAAITAEIRLRDRPGAAPLEIPLKLTGQPRSTHGAALPDLTANPWAGLPVLIRYVAHNVAGLRGVSGDAPAILPARAFINPIARALIDIRRKLALDPGDTAIAHKALDRLSLAAVSQLAPGNAAAGQLTQGEWLNLRGIAALLAEQPDDATQAETRLWQLALTIEDSGAADAKQRLEQARDALKDALNAPPSAEQQQKIAALSQALQQAMQRYLNALQQQAARAGQPPPEQAQPGQAQGKTIDPAQLDQMEKQMEDAARAGRMDEAMQRLQQLSAILDQLRSGHAQPGQNAQSRSDPDLDVLMRDQSALKSHADTRQSGQSQSGQSQSGQSQSGQPNQDQKNPDAKQDAQAQQALRQRLGALADKLGGQTGNVPDGLARADSAMRDAQAALARGDDRTASSAEQRALDGLKGAGQQMAQQKGNGQSGAGPGQQPGPGTDPLGRPLAQNGQDQNGHGQNDGANDTPTTGDAASSRALRDELRRRGADRTRPPAELDYIQKLLSF